MKRINWLMMLLASVMVFAVSCDDPEPAPGPDTPDEPNLEDVTFDIEISAVTKTTMQFNITPSNLEADYFCTVIDKTTADDYTMDQYLVSDIYQDITEAGSSIGERFDEYMPLMLDRGAIENARYTGLSAGTDYYLVVFVVDASNNYRFVGDVIKTPFTTESPVMVECTFGVEPTVTNTSATLKVTPSDTSLRWHMIIYPKEGFELYTGDVEAGGYGMSVDSFYQQYFNNEINQYLGAGYPESEIIAQLMPMGVQSVKASNLVANTEYAYLIAGITMDDDGAWISTEVHVDSFTSGDVIPSDNTFTIEVTDITDARARVSISVTNTKDKYCWLVGLYDGVSTADEIVNYIVKNYGGYMNGGAMIYSGDQSYNVSLEAPNKDYYVIAFGYAGGVTTDPVMYTFSSAEGDDPMTVEFTMTSKNAMPYTSDVEIGTSSKSVYFTVNISVPSLFDKEAIIKAENEYMDYMKAEYAKIDPTMTVASILNTYYYRDSMQFTASGLLPETEYMGYVLVYDIDTGHVIRVVEFPALVTTPALGSVTPTATWMGCFSGNEEAGTIFGDATVTKNRAIAVIKYDNFDGTRRLMTTSIEGDASNPADYLDTELWAYSIGYWTSCKLTSPFSFYLCNWNQDMTALAYCTDSSTGLPGGIARAWFKATAEDKKPISELQALYDEANTKAAASVAAPSSLVIGDIAPVSTPILAPVAVAERSAEAVAAPVAPSVVEMESTISHINILERIPRFNYRK